MTIRLFTAGLYGLAIFDLSSAANIPNQKTFCPVISVDAASNCQPPPSSFLNISRTPSTSKKEDVKFLEDAFSALAVLQNEYFRASNKTWPSSIDWTGAVVETVVSGMLTTLTKSLGSVVSDSSDGWAAKENLISSFYDQIISYYFGQDAEAIKGQVRKNPHAICLFTTCSTDADHVFRHSMTCFGLFLAGLRPLTSSEFTESYIILVL